MLAVVSQISNEPSFPVKRVFSAFIRRTFSRITKRKNRLVASTKSNGIVVSVERKRKTREEETKSIVFYERRRGRSRVFKTFEPLLKMKYFAAVCRSSIILDIYNMYRDIFVTENERRGTWLRVVAKETCIKRECVHRMQFCPEKRFSVRCARMSER